MLQSNELNLALGNEDNTLLNSLLITVPEAQDLNLLCSCEERTEPTSPQISTDIYYFADHSRQILQLFSML